MSDPLGTFNFEVVLTPSGQGGDEDLTRVASFSDVSGLELSVEMVTVREGGYHGGVRQLRGRTTSPALVLKRGLSTDRGFWKWVQRCIDGPFPLPYIDGEILCYPAAGSSATPTRWVFVNGLATKVRSADLTATGGQIAIEELHIAHEGLRREDP